MTFQEIEFKYKANAVSLSDFTQFCLSRNPKGFTLAAGYDHFYVNSNDDASFGRHRQGVDMNQMTFKRKTDKDNNFIRTEHNIDLLPFVTREQVCAMFKEFGYEYNTSIYKNCFIYKYDWYTLVYYVCYDSNMAELGRFVEIEMAEDYKWPSQGASYSELMVLEKLCKSVGAAEPDRVKKSLFELFRRQSA